MNNVYKILYKRLSDEDDAVIKRAFVTSVTLERLKIIPWIKIERCIKIKQFDPERSKLDFILS